MFVFCCSNCSIFPMLKKTQVSIRLLVCDCGYYGNNFFSFGGKTLWWMQVSFPLHFWHFFDEIFRRLFLSWNFAMAKIRININHNENQGKSMRQNRENLLFGIDCRTWPEGETTLFKRADLYGICAMLPWWKINVYSMPALSIFTSCAVWNKHIFLNLPVMSSSFLSLFFLSSFLSPSHARWLPFTTWPLLSPCSLSPDQ